MISGSSSVPSMAAPNIVFAPSGKTMLPALQALIAAAPASPTPTLYVTGHSLGGCMATMVALYLQAQKWTRPPTFVVFTFAAPTAGMQAFADYYDQQLTNKSPNSTYRVYGAWDVVPNAWATLSNVEQSFYPSPGPAQSLTVGDLIKRVAASTKNNVYVQTNQTPASSVVELNTATYGSSGSAYDSSATCKTTEDFLAQLAYQHANNTYLGLFGATVLPPVVPTVTGIRPNNGAVAGGTTVVITGTHFTPDSVVDFGSSQSALSPSSGPAAGGTLVTVVPPRRERR